MASSDTNTRISNLCCTICSEIYKSNDEVLCTKCGHVFHKTCFQEWVGRSATCPECRTQNPETQPIYLHIEDPTIANTKHEEETFDLINKVSLLERQLGESEQNFFDTQCALTFSEEQKDELKSQLDYINAINTSYEQAQTQTRAALEDAKQALSISKEQLNELKYQFDLMKALNSSYDQEQAQTKAALATAQNDLTVSKEQADELKDQLQNVSALNSSLEREQTETKESLTEAQHALSFGQQQINELKVRLKNLNELNSIYEQDQIQTKENLITVQRALSISQVKIESLNSQLAQKNVIIANFENDLNESEKNLKHVIEESQRLDEAARIRTEEINNLKLQNENCSVADLQRQLKCSESQVARLKQELISSKIENQNQNRKVENQFEEHKTDNVLLLEERIKRLEAKLKTLSLELENEIELSTKLTVENMKLEKNFAMQRKSQQAEQEAVRHEETKQAIVAQNEEELKESYTKCEKIKNNDLIDFNIL